MQHGSDNVIMAAGAVVTVGLWEGKAHSKKNITQKKHLAREMQLTAAFPVGLLPHFSPTQEEWEPKAGQQQ